MPGLIVWKNQEINKLRRDMDRLFARLRDDFAAPVFPRIARDVPFIDLSETEGHLIIRAEIPGINPEDLDISVTEDTLNIKGEIKQEFVREDEDYRRMERRYGSFSRSLKLPCRVMVEDVEATYANGVLQIVMPKCKPEPARACKVKIK
jgi:HSP20 family protein